MFADVVEAAGYGHVVPPMFEHVEVFHHLGEATDVVAKEMYEFTDRGGRRLALRPEQTASVVRMFVENRPNVPWKVWYAGPNFRAENVQKGRYRQFDQVGIEVLGVDDPYLDVEVIALAWRFYERLGLSRVRLVLNSWAPSPWPLHRALRDTSRTSCAVDGPLYAPRNPLACSIPNARRPRVVAGAPRLARLPLTGLRPISDRARMARHSRSVEVDEHLGAGSTIPKTTFEFAATPSTPRKTPSGRGR